MVQRCEPPLVACVDVCLTFDEERCWSCTSAQCCVVQSCRHVRITCARVSAEAKKHFHCLPVSTPGSQVKWAAAVVVFTVNVSAQLDERLHHAVVTIQRSKMQASSAVLIDRTHVSTHNCYQRCDRLLMPVPSSVHERSCTIYTPHLCVRSHLDQLQGCLRVPIPACAMQRSPSIFSA